MCLHVVMLGSCFREVLLDLGFAVETQNSVSGHVSAVVHSRINTRLDYSNYKTKFRFDPYFVGPRGARDLPISDQDVAYFYLLLCASCAQAARKTRPLGRDRPDPTEQISRVH